jgi:hypothetical protein
MFSTLDKDLKKIPVILLPQWNWLMPLTPTPQNKINDNVNKK